MTAPRQIPPFSSCKPRRKLLQLHIACLSGLCFLAINWLDIIGWSRGLMGCTPWNCAKMCRSCNQVHFGVSWSCKCTKGSIRGYPSNPPNRLGSCGCQYLPITSRFAFSQENCGPIRPTEGSLSIVQCPNWCFPFVSITHQRFPSWPSFPEPVQFDVKTATSP